MVTSDIPYDSPYTSLDDEHICMRISSEDCEACCLIHNIILKVFNNARRVFKFVSITEDIELLRGLCDKETVKLIEEKKKYNFFSVAYPELHAEISNNENLYELLTRWQSTVYQTYLLYVVDVDKVDEIFDILEKDKYKETDSLSKVWPKVKIVIKNEWEAENHNTFVIVSHKEYFEPIKECITELLKEE